MCKLFRATVIGVLLILLGSANAWAVKAYTTDARELPLRNTPNNSSRAILTLPPASPVEVLDQREWSRVSYTGPGGEAREGWVPTKLLDSRPPESAAIKQLDVENAALREQIGLLEKDKAGFQQREKDLTDKAARLSAAYEELKKGSTEYVKLKEEYDSTRTLLRNAQEYIQNLLQEQEGLRLSNRIQWFIAGAMVLFFGMLVGWGFGKRNKKRRAYY